MPWQSAGQSLTNSGSNSPAPALPLPCPAARVAAQNIVLLDGGEELQRYPDCECQTIGGPIVDLKLL